MVIPGTQHAIEVKMGMDPIDAYGVQQLKVFCGKKGLEVLHIVDPIDEYATQQLKESGGKKDRVMTRMVDPIDEYGVQQLEVGGAANLEDQSVSHDALWRS